ncbi:MAG: N-acetyl-gamma-glutamyl-phosphate reductase [Spirochaetes bacterium]|nr:MAG: N-acetyl-gamma-glutamyl-phosphate reductase [Spirochaetota bacterium]
MKKALIIGATGFGGLGLIEILLRHPGIQITQIAARKDAGVPISRVFPHLRGYFDMVVGRPEDIDYSGADIAFFSTPDRAGMTLIREFRDRGIPVIDYSGDFRFKTTDEYAVYAKNKGMETGHLAADTLADAVYGLPEIYADRIRGAKLVGNPGCFAICMTLGLLPAVEKKLIGPGPVICDGKTGVSGAGKNPGESNFYPQRYENVNTYREGRHQHLIEVENVLNERGSEPVKILFVPQIVPLSRGILVTSYAPAPVGCSTNDVLDIYRAYYADKPFVKVIDTSPNTTDVRGSNLCVIRPMVDERTGMLFVTSVIDNLMKGQSGNAVQNANLMLGFDETAGIDRLPFYP